MSTWLVGLKAAHGIFWALWSGQVTGSATLFIGDAQKLSLWARAKIDVNPDYEKARRRADRTPEWRFRRPVAANVDDEGRIMILECHNPRIQVYVKERDFVDAQFNL